MLVSNPEDTTNTLRGISYYKKRRYIYNCIYKRFLSLFGRFYKY